LVPTTTAHRAFCRLVGWRLLGSTWCGPIRSRRACGWICRTEFAGARDSALPGTVLLIWYGSRNLPNPRRTPIAGVRPRATRYSCERRRRPSSASDAWSPGISGSTACRSFRTRRSAGVSAARCGQRAQSAAGYSGARTGVSWCSASPRKNGFCSWRRAIKNMIGRPRMMEPMPSRNTLPISTLVPGMVQPPR
jgi:hypothetical protein